jgi:hypothetical protein
MYRLKYMLDGKEVGRENVTVTAGNWLATVSANFRAVWCLSLFRLLAFN